METHAEVAPVVDAMLHNPWFVASLMDLDDNRRFGPVDGDLASKHLLECEGVPSVTMRDGLCFTSVYHGLEKENQLSVRVPARVAVDVGYDDARGFIRKAAEMFAAMPGRTSGRAFAWDSKSSGWRVWTWAWDPAGPRAMPHVAVRA